MLTLPRHLALSATPKPSWHSQQVNSAWPKEQPTKNEIRANRTLRFFKLYKKKSCLRVHVREADSVH